MSNKSELKVTVNGSTEGFAYFCVTQSDDATKCVCSRTFPEDMSDETSQIAVQAMAVYAIKMLPITPVLEAAVAQLTDGDS